MSDDGVVLAVLSDDTLDTSSLPLPGHHSTMPPSSLTSLDQLRGMLNRGERVTLDRAAEKVGVSRRQVRRLLKTIAEEGS